MRIQFLATLQELICHSRFCKHDLTSFTTSLDLSQLILYTRFNLFQHFKHLICRSRFCECNSTSFDTSLHLTQLIVFTWFNFNFKRHFQHSIFHSRFCEHVIEGRTNANTKWNTRNDVALLDEVVKMVKKWCERSARYSRLRVGWFHKQIYLRIRKKQSKEEYELCSLRSILAIIERYLKNINYISTTMNLNNKVKKTSYTSKNQKKCIDHYITTSLFISHTFIRTKNYSLKRQFQILKFTTM